MAREIKMLHDYFLGTRIDVPGANLDLATRGQLSFETSLLPGNANPELQIDAHSYEDGPVVFYRYRNFQGMNVDSMSTKLLIEPQDLLGEIAEPLGFEQSTRAILQSDGALRDLGGYTQYDHSYNRSGYNDGLDQEVMALHLPQRVSPVIETISIKRHVSNSVGDMVYGDVILHKPDITDRLGFKMDRNPVFLALVRGLVLGITYGPEVIGETSYATLDETGIKASFNNDANKAELNLNVGDLSFKLWLGKILKPGYPALLFSAQEEWVTDSGVRVYRTPKDKLN